MNISLAFATLQELTALLARNELSREELLQYTLKRFEEYKHLGTAVELFEDPLHGVPQTGALAGIPGIIKDNLCQKNRITACASKMLQHYRAPYDATAVARLRAQGAYSIGRANCDEFAIGSSTEKSYFFPTHNPWDRTKVPGGTSGGSAAAVAAGLVPWALGTDTGGSIRQPAAFCGVVGMKPTYGRVSRFGLVATASSLDTVGPITRTVYDNAMVFSALAGYDPHDATSINKPDEDFTVGLDGRLPEGFTLGVLDNILDAEGMDADVAQALQAVIDEYERLGAKIKRISVPMLDYGVAVYLVINRAEASSNLARYDGVKYGYRASVFKTLEDMYVTTRTEGFGEEVRNRILVGNYVLSAGHADAYYNKAREVRRYIRAACIEALTECSALFMPVTPTAAFGFNAFSTPLQMDLQDYFTVNANLVGLPSLAVPCGFTRDNLPISFQLMGADVREHVLYKAAYAYEQAMPWHTMHPA